MGRRLRAIGLTAAGLMAAIAPLIAAQPAGAANNVDTQQAQLTFVDYSGHAVTCTVLDSSTHNNDDPSQPYAHADASVRSVQSCITNVSLELIIHFRDKDGVARVSRAYGYTALELDAYGAYSGVTTTLNANFYNCDLSQNETCEISVTTAPK